MGRFARHLGLTIRLGVCWLALCCLGPGLAQAEITLYPPSVVLESPEASQQAIVTRIDDQGLVSDLTRSVRFEITPPGIAVIDQRGLIRPLANGQGELLVHHAEATLRVPLVMRRLENPAPVSFRNEIVPILTKAGCNSGGCHGKAEGQNGFKLSIFGFDALSDHQALVMEGRGRRVSPASPERSLVFLKGSARVPHGGGRKIEPGSYRDRRLLRWIAEGAQFDSADDADEPDCRHRDRAKAPQPARRPIATVARNRHRRRGPPAWRDDRSRIRIERGVDRRRRPRRFDPGQRHSRRSGHSRALFGSRGGLSNYLASPERDLRPTAGA